MGAILTGSILGLATCATARRSLTGRRLKVPLPQRELLQSTFEMVGIPMVMPVSGHVGICTMVLAMPLLQARQVVYCMEHDGSACNRCIKCFRRDIIRIFMDETHRVDWSRYRTPQVNALLSGRPIYCHHIFMTAFSLKPHLFPTWIHDLTADLPRISTDWCLRTYTPAFDMYPPQWRECISSRVLAHVPPMTQADHDSMIEAVTHQ